MQLRCMPKASEGLAKWAAIVDPTIQLHKAQTHLVEHLGGSHQTPSNPSLWYNNRFSSIEAMEK
jgi:hypothetical protein